MDNAASRNNSAKKSKPSWLAELFGRASLLELERLCQRLGLGLKAGVDVIKLLDTEASRGSAKHRSALSSVRAQVASGFTMAKAFENAQPYFPLLLIQMVSAGEASGRLDRVFAQMSDHYSSLRRARNQFLSKITWPLIQLAIAIGVVCLVIGIQGLVPSADSEFSFDPLGFGLRGASGVATFLFLIGLFLCFIAALTIAIWKNLFQCHRWLIPAVLPIPIIGSVFLNLALARFSMTLSMLLNAGVDAVRCVRQAFLSTSNDYYVQKLPIAVEHVQRGESLANAFHATQVFDDEFLQGVEVGELSGNETESLDRLADEYRRRAESALSQLSIFSGFAIWGLIAALIIFIILRMAIRYVNLLNSLM